MKTENELNEMGDELAEMLGMRKDHDASPDSQGRTRWITSEGNKTGFGLLRTLRHWLKGIEGLD